MARHEKSSISDIMEVAHPGSFFRFFRDVNVAQIAPHFDWTIKMLCSEFSTCYIKLPNGNREPMPPGSHWCQGRMSRHDMKMAIAKEPNDFPFPGSPRGTAAPPDYTYPYFPHALDGVWPTEFAPPSPTYGNPDDSDDEPISIRRDELKARRNMQRNKKTEADHKRRRLRKTQFDDDNMSSSSSDTDEDMAALRR